MRGPARGCPDLADRYCWAADMGEETGGVAQQLRGNGQEQERQTVTKRSKTLVRDHLIIGGAVMLLTLAGMLFKPAAEPMVEIWVLLAALSAGGLFTRFGLPRPWMGHLALLLVLVVTFLSGEYIIGWFGGFIAGTNLGVVWRALALTKKIEPTAWTVDDRGYTTAAEARNDAVAALHCLDGKKNWRLTVEHGPARFEASGNAESGLVCHRNPQADQERSWAVLVRPDQTADESVDVPMGNLTGFIPSRFVNDRKAVEAALEAFLSDPDAASFGPEWITDKIAEGLRLGS